MLNAQQAAERFPEGLRKAGVTSDGSIIWNGWTAFKEFCAVPLMCASEGFIFHAGYGVNFPPPEHERVVDYSSYEVAFTRYWTETAGGPTHVAECSFRISDHPGLRDHEWVDVEIDASGDPAKQRARLEKFVCAFMPPDQAT
jgi:hypothetical protein